MKFLFFARHFSYLRNFESVLCTLAERGHQVHVAAEREETFGGRELVERLTRRYPGITAGPAPARTDGWERLATKIRLTLDYFRYLEPAYETTPRLRYRARARVPSLLLWAAATPPFRGAAGRRRLARLLTRWEQAIPRDPEIARYMKDAAPDAVLITPLVGVVASPQLDYLYTAQALGLPTALCVWSWDHLSSKALIRTVPDRVFVWNPTQRQEAVELHGVPDDRIVVTGAQCFDQWFDRQPSRDRATFCTRVGLPDEGPFLLWVCSALFRGSLEEAGLVRRWVRALRESGHASLRDVNILIRPHPSRMSEWDATEVAREDRVAVRGGNPVDDASRADYFDSMYYSKAVVGLNTSAFIEAAIAGRPVFTVLLPEFYENQEGTIHFHYLLNVAGGLLNAARSLDVHAAQLDAVLRGQEADPGRSRRFVESFVRPYGLQQVSTERFVDAVEQLGSARPADLAAPVEAAAPLSVRALAAFERGMIGHALMLDARERHERARSRDVMIEENRERRDKLSAKAEKWATKARVVEQRRQEQDQVLKSRERQRTRRKRRKLGKELRERLGLG